MPMLHQGFDLSRFRKVASDKTTTTLKHANGHEIKLAHGGLTPKMKADLEKLPMHLADGGDAITGAADTPEQEDPQAMDPESPADADGTTSPAVPPKPDVMPDGDTINVVADPSPPELDAHDAAWANDLSNGHITPETYRSLFAKKDTLGKVGTIFGLMVGGAGAGLTHSPNLAMEMMNKEIQNDLDAQKSSKHNATNYYNAMVNLMQGSANADLTASSTALNNMNISMLQELTGIVGQIRPGPNQQRAAAMLNQIMHAIGTQNAQRNQQTGQELGRRGLDSVRADNAGKFSGPVNDRAVALLSKFGPMVGIGDPTGESGTVKTLRNGWESYKDSFKGLDSVLAGQTPGVIGDIADIAANFVPGKAMSGATGGLGEIAKRFSQRREALITQLSGLGLSRPDIETLVPSVHDYDSAETRSTKMAAAAQIFKRLEAGGTPNMAKAEAMRFAVRSPMPYDNDAQTYMASKRSAPAKTSNVVKAQPGREKEAEAKKAMEAHSP